MDSKLKNIDVIAFVLFLTFGITGCQNIKTNGNFTFEQEVFDKEEFKVQPGDTLKIIVWKKDDFSQEIAVQPDGKIRLVMLGEFFVKGKTLSQIQAEITEKTKKFVVDPRVEVSLMNTDFGVYVFGEVKNVGVVTARNDINILQAVVLSGGVNPFGDKSNIVLIRRRPGKEKRFKFNLFDYMAGVDLHKNMNLQPGDMIFVPKLPY